MFDQLAKRSNRLWVYTTGRFAEERRAFLCDLSKGGRSLLTLRNVNRLLLAIAERVNIRQRTPITERQIVRAADDWVKTSCGQSSTTETRDIQRRRFIFVAKHWLFLYNSGARATEAVRVSVEDPTWDSTGTGSVKIHGKGRKVRFCPLWKKTMAELQPLIRGRDTVSPLFLNRYGEAMTRFGILALVTRHAEAAAKKIPSLKTKRISPHTIRHTTATHLLRAGVDLNTIRAWLGHASVDTTNIYAETDLALKAKALAACDPGGGHRRIKKKWREDPGLMEFLHTL